MPPDTRWGIGTSCFLFMKATSLITLIGKRVMTWKEGPWPDFRFGPGNCVDLLNISLTNIPIAGIMQRKLLMNWKRYGRTRSWPNLRYPGICLEVLTEIT
jgi:hypothetical protein